MNLNRALLLAAGGALVALAVTVNAGTYALYSDFDTAAGNSVAAASVALGTGSSGDLALTFPPLVVDVPAVGMLTVDYQGTVAADVTLGLEPGGATEFCERGPDGWHNRFGLAVVVTIAANGPVSYCSLLDSEPVSLRAAAQPGADPFTTPVELLLTENSIPGTEPITAMDLLVVEATGGFSDRAEGTLTAPAAPVPAPTPEQMRVATESSAAPPELSSVLLALSDDPGAVIDPALLPEECRDRVFRPDQVVTLTVADDMPWTAAEARGIDSDPLLIFGTGSDDDITGTAGDDCIVGGDGDDRLLGAGGADVLLGGAGRDVLFGGDGVDLFDGGADRAICDGGPDGRATGPGCDPVPTPPTTSPTAAPPATTSAPPVPTPSLAPQPEAPSTTTTDPAPTTTETESPAPAAQVESTEAQTEAQTGDFTTGTTEPIDPE